MKHMINIDSSKVVTKIADAIVVMLKGISEESDQVKLKALDVLESSASTPITISNNTFSHKDVL